MTEISQYVLLCIGEICSSECFINTLKILPIYLHLVLKMLYFFRYLLSNIQFSNYMEW